MVSAPKSFRQTIGLGPSEIDLSLKNSALVVIDAQGTCQYFSAPHQRPKLTDSAVDAPSGGLEITDSASSLKAMAQAVDLYRKAGNPVIWVQHSAGAGAPIFNPDNESFDFIGDLRPVGSEKVIIKGAPSSYVSSSFALSGRKSIRRSSPPWRRIPENTLRSTAIWSCVQRLTLYCFVASPEPISTQN